jgi:flagellin
MGNLRGFSFMGLSINTNNSILGAQNQTRRNILELNQANERLASLQRINRAADDAAGLAIAERLNTLVRQSQVEVNNLQSGINVVQTADSGLEIQQNAVQRIRELSLQAANGTLSDDNRQALNTEVQQLLGQIDDVARDTQFNNQTLLDEDRTISLGTESDSLQVETRASTLQSLGLTGLDISTAESAASAFETLDTASENINSNRSELGAQLNRFERAIEQREVEQVNTLDAESRIRDADVARTIIERTMAEVRTQSGLSAIIQGNITSQSVLRVLGG